MHHGNHKRHSNAPSDRSANVDVKKLQVNAQVTALTALIEVLGTFTIVIGLSITNSNVLLTFIHIGIFYLILLPYSFLMNTSDNKNRIVEYGWKNVFLNLVGRSSSIHESTDNDKKGARPNKNKDRKREKSLPSIRSNKIFWTREAQNAVISKDIKGRSTLEVMQKERILGNKEHHRQNTEESEMKVIDIEEQEYQRETLQKLIAGMVNNIDDEVKYKEDFNKLSVFMKYHKKGMVLSERELESEILFNVK